MGLMVIVLKSLLAGVFAGSLAVLLTAPRQYVAPTFLCGVAGLFTRLVLVAWGTTSSYATAVASAVVVLVGALATRRHEVSPVVVIGGVLPLGSAVAVFNAIVGLMRVARGTGDASAAALALSANAGEAIAGSLAIAMGLWAGLAIVRIAKPEPTGEAA